MYLQNSQFWPPTLWPRFWLNVELHRTTYTKNWELLNQCYRTIINKRIQIKYTNYQKSNVVMYYYQRCVVRTSLLQNFGYYIELRYFANFGRFRMVAERAL